VVYPSTVLYVRSVLRVTGVVTAACVCATVLGVGVPLGWVWVASQLQPTAGQRISGLAALVVLLGPPATYVSVLILVGRVGTHGHGAAKPLRMTWNHPDEVRRRRDRPTTALEEMVVLATLLLVLGFEVWFFLFAHNTRWGSG
jgi:hypothetical protein